MVAASQPLAVNAGIEILKKGGNAADAAVAVAAALNVTEPRSTGLGGDCFCVFYNANERTVKGINGSGRTPAALSVDYLRARRNIKGHSIPFTDINSVTVPGAAAGWLDTVEWFGSGRLTMTDVLEPAIRLAEEGFPISEISAFHMKEIEGYLKEASGNFGELLPGGQAPVAGQIVKNPTLAETFRAIAEQGHDGFYGGRVAGAIVNIVRSKGGLLTLRDMASHQSELIEPVSIDYDDVTVWECPPNGQGITALMALGIIKALQETGVIETLDSYKVNSVEWIHVLVEALKIAFADTRYHVADPEFYETPTNKLLTEEYLRQRAGLFNPERATTNLTHGCPKESCDTVYFCVVDDEGNACSFINSIYFGTHVVPKGTGIILQSRGTGFSLVKDTSNCLYGGNRPYHTIIPAMVTKRTSDGTHDLWGCLGVMGGFMQPQGHVQVLLNMLHHEYSPQATLDLPRFYIAPSDAGDFADPVVNIEEGVDPKVVEALRGMGHKVEVRRGMDRLMFGKGQVILEHQGPEGRVLSGGSDGRGDGLASGW